MGAITACTIKRFAGDLIFRGIAVNMRGTAEQSEDELNVAGNRYEKGFGKSTFGFNFFRFQNAVLKTSHSKTFEWLPRLRARPKGSALWKPAAFVKAGETFFLRFARSSLNLHYYLENVFRITRLSAPGGNL